jgi:hypothetical protein
MRRSKNKLPFQIASWIKHLSHGSKNNQRHAWAKGRLDPRDKDIAWTATGCILGFCQPNNRMSQTQERNLLPHTQSYLDIEISRTFLLGSQALVLSILLKRG